MQKPELATADFCALDQPTQVAAYGAYVDYLLYTAEQMIDTSPEWRAPMAGYLGDHMAYLCSPEAQSQPDVQDMLAELDLPCTPEVTCG